jgi:hypothetical protein
VVPERDYLKRVSYISNSYLQDVDELLESVHGAVIARLQLGFDNVADEPWNLRPLIKDLEVRING